SRPGLPAVTLSATLVKHHKRAPCEAAPTQPFSSLSLSLHPITRSLALPRSRPPWRDHPRAQWRQLRSPYRTEPGTSLTLLLLHSLGDAALARPHPLEECQVGPRQLPSRSSCSSLGTSLGSAPPAGRRPPQRIGGERVGESSRAACLLSPLPASRKSKEGVACTHT
ncbi:hypothetical protein ABPG75_009113, partial [Micractinium tetrahymenae]